MKKYLILFLLFIFPGWQIHADASIGSVQADTNAVLSTGQSGLIVTVNNIHITGCSGKRIILAVNVYENDSQKSYPNSFIFLDAEDDYEDWDRIRLEIPNYDLKNCLGAGTKQVYLICTLSPYSPGSTTEVIPGSTAYLNITLKIPADTGSELNRDNLTERTVNLIREIKNEYGLDIYTNDDIRLDSNTTASYTFTYNTEENAYWLNRSILLFHDFLETLPREFIQDTEIEGVLFIYRIYFEDLGEVGGGFSKDNRFIFCGDMMNYAENLEKVFLHELFHVLDIKFSKYFNDSEWCSLDPSGTKYVSVHEMYENDIYYAVTEYPEPGFVTGYCFADSYQDRAETFSYMLSPHLYPKLTEWIRTDSLLAAKVKFLKEGLVDLSSSLEDYFSSVGL